MFVKDNGTWKKGRPWVNVAGTWVKSTAVWINKAGTWIKQPFLALVGHFTFVGVLTGHNKSPKDYDFYRLADFSNSIDNEIQMMDFGIKGYPSLAGGNSTKTISLNISVRMDDKHLSELPKFMEAFNSASPGYLKVTNTQWSSKPTHEVNLGIAYPDYKYKVGGHPYSSYFNNDESFSVITGEVPFNSEVGQRIFKAYENLKSMTNKYDLVTIDLKN